MLLLIIFLSAISLAVTSNYDLLDQDYYNLNQADKIFDQFIAKYNKEYQSDEFEKRFEIFKENLKDINKWNKESDGAVFGINSFSDMTSEEFFRCYTGVSGNMTSEFIRDLETRVKAPAELDYRRNGYVTAIKNQQRCGSCYTFAAIGNIEGQYAKKHGQLLTLSEQQALDCDRADGGCQGGQVHNVFNALMREGGSELLQDYPYVAVQQQCRTNRQKIAVRLIGGGRMQVTNEEALKEALASYGPLAVYMNTSPEMHALRGGIFKPTSCYGGLHAVTLIGYGQEGAENYWLIKNSWGQQWGEGGYFRLIRGHSACGIGRIYTACAQVA